ncbi:hypothetical protein N0V85_006572 [Neurospora sp. IMI 360204]|nr:hypothetical protein N0V85_006572 [Neurospora sp. IMI 360204]
METGRNREDDEDDEDENDDEDQHPKTGRAGVLRDTYVIGTPPSDRGEWDLCSDDELEWYCEVCDRGWTDEWSLRLHERRSYDSSPRSLGRPVKAEEEKMRAEKAEERLTNRVKELEKRVEEAEQKANKTEKEKEKVKKSPPPPSPLLRARRHPLPGSNSSTAIKSRQNELRESTGRLSVLPETVAKFLNCFPEGYEREDVSGERLLCRKRRPAGEHTTTMVRHL